MTLEDMVNLNNQLEEQKDSAIAERDRITTELKEFKANSNKILNSISDVLNNITTQVTLRFFFFFRCPSLLAFALLFLVVVVVVVVGRLFVVGDDASCFFSRRVSILASLFFVCVSFSCCGSLLHSHVHSTLLSLFSVSLYSPLLSLLLPLCLETRI